MQKKKITTTDQPFLGGQQPTSMDYINSPLPKIPKNIEIKELLDAIQNSATIANPMKSHQDNDIVIFQGFSGVGKSSTILTLAGEQMIGFNKELSQETILMSQDPKGKNNVFSGRTYDAATRQPACLELSPQFNKNRPVMLWDMPGTGDNRGITQIIINSYYYTRIFAIQPLIKMALVISYRDMIQSQRCQTLSERLQNFVNMYGDVGVFRSSLVLIITKCRKKFTKQKARQCFKDILSRKNSLGFIRQNKHIQNLVGYLANGTVKILTIHQPTVDDDVYQSKPVNVTAQYRPIIKQFADIISALEPTSKIKLINPLNRSQIQQIKGLVQSTNDQYVNSLNKMVDIIKAYLNTFTVNIDQNDLADQVKEVINQLKRMKQFEIKISQLVSQYPTALEKAKQYFSQIHQLFMQYGINVVEANNKGVVQRQCTILIRLKESLIMVNFLHVLTGNSYNLQYQRQSVSLSQLEAIKLMITAIRRINIFSYWNKNENLFKAKINHLIKTSFGKHLNEWESYQIYQSWKKNYRYFPSFAYLLTKYNDASDKGPDYPLVFFRHIQKVEDKVGVISDEINKINIILEYNKETLGINVQNRLINQEILPEFKMRQEYMIEKATSYKYWEKPFMNTAVEEYSNQHPQEINGIQDINFFSQQQSRNDIQRYPNLLRPENISNNQRENEIKIQELQKELKQRTHVATLQTNRIKQLERDLQQLQQNSNLYINRINEAQQQINEAQQQINKAQQQINVAQQQSNIRRQDLMEIKSNCCSCWFKNLYFSHI